MPKKIEKLAVALVLLITLNLYIFSSHRGSVKRDSPSPVIAVSVVIPVYNSQEFIERAISTLLNQTLKNIEFIFVDDKSPDNSSQVIEKYVATDRRFRLIRNEKNLGPGLTRNVGIEAAYGQYVGFLDPDDWVNPEFYEALYEKATETSRGSYDIAKGQFVRVRNQTYEYDKNDWWKVIGRKRKIHEVFTWQHYTAIFKRAVLEEHPDARYGNNSYGEDAIFLMKACYYSNNITFTNIAKYYYLMRSGSLSTRSQYVLLYNTYQYFSEIDDFLKAVGDNSALEFTRKNTVKRIEKMLRDAGKPSDENERMIYKTVNDYLESIRPPKAQKKNSFLNFF